MSDTNKAFLEHIRLETQINKTLKQRHKEYGSFKDNCDFAMQFVYENTKNIDILQAKEQLNSIHYYIFMIGAKLARLNFNQEHKDSKLDLLGYTDIYKKTCDYRFNFVALNEPYIQATKLKEHRYFIDLVNERLNTQEIKIHE